MAVPDLVPYVPATADALEDAFVPVTMADPGVISAHDQGFTSAKFLFKPHSDELYALLAGRVVSKAYATDHICDATLAVGDLVYHSTVAGKLLKADAAALVSARVCGVVRYKPTTTSCRIDHFWRVNGVTAGTSGSPVYLADGGGYSAAPGTFRRIVGTYRTTTSISCFASSSSNFVDDGTAIQTLTDAATVAVDLALGNNAQVTLGGNRTLGAPTNGRKGQSGIIKIIQDGTGSRTLAYNAAWKFAVGAPTLSTAAAAIDLLFWYTPDGTNFYAELLSRAAGAAYLSSTVATGASGTLSTATQANVTSLTLTQGVWDVLGAVNFDMSAAAVSELQAGINSTSATLPTDGTEEYATPLISSQTYKSTVAVSRKRFTVADGATTTVYLIAKATFTGTSVKAFGQLTASRVPRSE